MDNCINCPPASTGSVFDNQSTGNETTEALKHNAAYQEMSNASAKASQPTNIQANAFN